MSKQIPLRVLRPAALELIPGPNPSASEVKHGARSKLAILRQLVAADKNWRKRVLEWDRQRSLAGANAELAARGYRGEIPTPTDNAERDRQMWELYRSTALYNLESTGEDEAQWFGPDGSRVPCITDEERKYALEKFVARKAGRLDLLQPKKLAPPEYVPSCIDWNEVFRAVSK